MNWIGPAITAGMGIASSIHGNKERRKESEKTFERQKQLNEQAQELGIKTWKETNFSAQKEELEKAGLNAGLLYGMSGAGGGTVGSGGGGTAQQANIENVGMDIAGMAQIALMKAQKENIEADTKVKEADANKRSGVDTAQTVEQTRGIKFVNDLNESLRAAKWSKEKAEADMAEILTSQMRANWATYAKVAYNGKEIDDPTSLAAQVVKAGLHKTLEELNQIKASINKTNADTKQTEIQTIIDKYKANLAEQGINPDAPAIEKLLIDLKNSAAGEYLINRGKEAVEMYKNFKK